MKTKTQLTISTIFLIFVLCLSLIHVNPVLADDAPPTEPPTEEVSEPPTEEAEVSPELISAPPQGDVPTADEETVADLLSEIPDNTDVMILDENGNPIPLGSEAAAEIIQEEDPLWCPVGAPLNSPLCRNFTGGSAITNMLTDMRNNTGTYDENGVIYFTSSAGGSLALTNAAGSLSTDFTLLSTFNLTLTGGWNGNLNSPTFSGQTNFGSNSLTIGTAGNPWIGSITLNNFVFNDVDNTPGVQVFTTNGSVTLNNVDADDTDDVTPINVVVTGTGNVTLTGVDVSDGTDGNGITITTNSGNITLADVDVTNQDDGYTANLQSQSGNISITNGSSNGSSFNGGDNSLGFVATTNTGSITMTGASGSGNQITFNDADGSSNGATLSAATVTLTQVTANNNNMNGIQISNANTITLNNVIATNNGTDVSGAPDLGSGLRVFGTGSTIVNINGGTYSNNERYGIEISNGSVNIISNPSMTGNDEGNLIIIDSTAPTISPTFNCSVPGNGGWCRGTITINWNVSDAQSAVSTSGCQTSFSSNTSPAGTTLSCSATSTGGTTNSSVVVRRDATAPNVSSTKSPNDNLLGWNNTDVVVTFTGTDSNSGIASCTPPASVTTEGANQSRTGTCTDVAGNTGSSTENNINIDKTAPTVTGNRSPAPNVNGWNTTNVNISFSGSDALSGISGLNLFPFLGCSSSSTVTAEGANQSRTGGCVDRAGNVATVTVNNINIDKTNPVAVASTSPAPNANGWNNSDVVVTFSGTDNLSGITSCTAAATVSTEGSNQSRSGTCTDLAGRVSNTATANNINIDKTPPVITLVSRTPANGNGWNNGNVTVQWSCSDPLSGVVSAAVSETVTTEGANQSATATCQDLAGNTASDTQSDINIDKTAPTFNLADVIAEATGPSGANVNYSALANDNLDSSPTVNCLPASGGVYPLGTTPVTCTATDDADNTSAPSSFNIIVQDTTPPTISPVTDMTVNTLSINGKKVEFSAPATSDIVDGSGFATCTPDSGSFFVIGDNPVTCSATDLHGNTATVSFIITVEEREEATTPTTGNGLFIPLTGGSSIKLSCVPPESFTINMTGARIIFNNLCEYEAFINELEQLELPAELPSEFNYVDGYSINIIKDGKPVSPLPQDASVAIEFNIPNEQKGADFGVLYWNGSQWTEIAGEMTDSGHFKVDVTSEIANSNTFIFVTK